MPNGDLKEIWGTVNRIESKGCARREDDMKRVDNLEKWVQSLESKIDRIFYGVIAILASLVAFFAKYTIFGGIK